MDIVKYMVKIMKALEHNRGLEETVVSIMNWEVIILCGYVI